MMKTIYYNGTVYTGESELCGAFAVENGFFVFTGTSGQAMELAGPEDLLVDLKGHFVCSGFNDSHMHLLGYGSLLSSAALGSHTGSLKDMIAYMKDFAASRPSGKDSWIMGRGWNHDYFSDVSRMPDRYDLDQVSSDHPVCAVRACGHCLVVNSRALELLGICADTPLPEGGKIGLTDGIPDGRFFDAAMDLVYGAIPAPDKNEVKSMIMAACHALNSYGVTSSQTDDYCTFRNLKWNVIHEAYRELEAEGKLTVRVYEQSHFSSRKELEDFMAAGNRTGTGSDLFRTGPLKLMGDGALGARTAYLSAPYADDPSTRGLPMYSQEVLDDLIGYAHCHGMQIAVHTIGDACLDQVLNAFEKAFSICPGKGRRHGIVHCQITREDQLERIRRLDLHVYAQSIFLDYDIHIVEQRVGKTLAETSYCWKTLLDSGVTVSNGTDCPVELPDAMAGIQCAVTRKTIRDQAGPYLPSQRFTVREALDSYTSMGAFSSFEENFKGKVREGMAADFVVLGENPFLADPGTLHRIPVLATVLGGKTVYGKF